jgi:chromate reductase
MRKIKILAISGSLRPQSSSHKILQLAAALMPENVAVIESVSIGTLPHFDGAEKPPAAVTEFLDQVKIADGVLICLPEYAFGVPGSLKNALDWTVGNGEFAQKNVAYITAATSGEKAHESLGFTLTAMASVISGALLIPHIRARLTPEGTPKDPALTESLRDIVNGLLSAIKKSAINVS